MIEYIFIVLYFVSITNCSIQKQTNERYHKYNDMIQWGKAHKLTYSKIALNFSLNSEKYIAIDNIEKDELIMTIPSDIFITFNKTFKICSKKDKKLWNKLNASKTDVFLGKEIKQQSFISYIQEKAYRHKNGKFYQYYKPYLEFINDNLDNFPVFYSDEELELIQKTHIGRIAIKAKESIQEEHDYLTSTLSADSIIDTYMLFRVLTETQTQKGINETLVIPFLPLFTKHPKIYNLYEEIDKTTGSLLIRAKISIHQGDVLTMKSHLGDNTANLLYYGVTYENIKKTYYPMLILTEELREEIKYSKTIASKVVDIAKDNFISECIQDYKNITKEIYNDDSIFKGLNLLYRNLGSYLDKYNSLRPSDFYKVYLLNQNRINVERVIDEEKALILKRMKEVKKEISKNEAVKQKEKLQMTNNDL